MVQHTLLLLGDLNSEPTIEMQDCALGFKILVYVHCSYLQCNDLTLLYSLLMEKRITLVTYLMIPFSDSQLGEWLTGTKATNCLRKTLF